MISIGIQVVPVVAAIARCARRVLRKITGRRKRQALAREQQRREAVRSAVTSACAVTAVTLALAAILIASSKAG